MHGTRTGSAQVLQRRLNNAADPLTLYAALADRGRRRDTMLLERTAGPSLLMDQAALRIEARGQEVRIAALTAGGRNVMDMLANELAHFLTERTPDTGAFAFPRPDSPYAAERLAAPSPFDVVRTLLRLPSAAPEEAFAIAMLGIVAFDHVDMFEDLPANAEDALGFPDFLFWLPESLIIFDPGAPARLVCTAFGGGEQDYFSAAERLTRLIERCEAATPLAAAPPPGDPGQTDTDLDDAAYRNVVSQMREHIARGDIYQVVPSRIFRTPCPEPFTAYAALHALDPSPYRFFVAGPDHLLFGASPETSVRVTGEGDQRIVEVKPIAGTRPRGRDDDEDDRLEAEMRLDAKETAEHMMLVDLARNDVARISEPGTRRVAKLMTVERYARVMHLVSSVTGRLKAGLDAVHALTACLNVGTLTGAPKIRATQLLRAAERTKRGPYGGAIGWLNGDGEMDTGVIIRTAVVKDGIAYVRAGAGVVHDSDPQAEADETRRKASALLSVLAGCRSA